MNVLFKFAVYIAIVMIIYSIVDVLVSGNKSAEYVKSSLVLIIVIIFFGFVFEIDIDSINNFNIDEYKIDNSAVWEQSLNAVSEELENQITILCSKNGLEIDNCVVKLESIDNEIKVRKIYLSGRDKTQAKNLIIGYLNLKSEYIDINGAIQNE